MRSTLDESYRDGQDLLRDADFYRARCNSLLNAKRMMREPERTILCDILANGKLLPDPNGERYGKSENDKPSGRTETQGGVK